MIEDHDCVYSLIQIPLLVPFAVYADAHAKCQRFYPKVQTSPDSPENAGEISKSWCAVTGASLPVAVGRLRVDLSLYPC